MARIIQTETKTKLGFRIINHYVDGTSTFSDFYENDEVTDLSYVENEEVCTLSGRIAKINVDPFNVVRRATKNITKPIEEVLYVPSVVIDHSETNQSKISVVPAREILEYASTGEIKRVEVVPVMTVDLKVTLSDGTSTEATVEPGTTMFNVTTIGNGTESDSSFKVKSIYYTLGQNEDVSACGVITDEALARTIPFVAIKSCGEKGLVVEAGQTLADALASAAANDEVGGIVLPAAKFKEGMTVTGEVTLFGANFGVVANSGERCSDVIAETETVVADAVNLEANADVVMNGLTFTEKSIVNVNGAKSVTFKNCKFTGATAYTAKSFLMKAVTPGEAPVKLVMENCYFGSNTITGTKKYYNLLEMNFTLADGSAIRNCYFAESNCTHNLINLYQAEEGATITVENNYFEMSRNAIRIGFKGDTACTVNVKNNTYVKTDTNNPAYAGLMLVQPYATETTTMKHVRINIDNTTKPEGQLYYFEIGAVGVPFEGEDRPVIYVDGVLQKN